MTAHSFVDEYKHSAYFLVAVLIRPAHVARLRPAVNALVMPGQRRIHFHNESNGRRGQIMGQILEMPLEAVIYNARDPGSEKAARHDCLTHLIRDHLARDIRRLVIEQDDSLMNFDKKLLAAEVRAAGAGLRFSYEHVKAHHEPLLAIPDAIAWCWARGGPWRVKAKHLVSNVHQV